MEIEVAREIISCLPKGRTLFHYFPDRYAVYMLSCFIGEGKTIVAIKASPFAKLLNRPSIKPIVAVKGNGILQIQDFAACWAEQPECYLLTLGIWGPENRNKWNRYAYQTTRPGVNLVLHLNFSSLHNEQYRNLIQPSGDKGPFETPEHPIARKGFHTLAWSRLDIDMDTGEALIEEIQTDWLRIAYGARLRADDILADRETRRAIETVYFGGCEIDPRAMQIYFDDVLCNHIPVWDEALLTAVIDFLVDELGLRHIYYHDFDCGRRLKNINGLLPPRSVYSKLPARFCFDKVDEAPRFLTAVPTKTLKTLIRGQQVRFWKLEF